MVVVKVCGSYIKILKDKMRNSTFICLFLAVSFGACNGHKLESLTNYTEAKDSEYVIQAMKLKDQTGGNIIKYGVRVFPGKGILSLLTEENKQALWYQMDSSFYLQTGSKKFYADMIEPIANGQKNNFEYLLMFEIDPGMNFKDMSLAFNDKYLSHKTHYLELNSK